MEEDQNETGTQSQSLLQEALGVGNPPETTKPQAGEPVGYIVRASQKAPDNPPVDNAQVIPKAALPQQNTAPTPGPGEVWRKANGECVLVTDHVRGGVAACLEAETFRPTAVHPTELAHKLGTLNNNFELF